MTCIMGVGGRAELCRPPPYQNKDMQGNRVSDVEYAEMGFAGLVQTGAQDSQVGDVYYGGRGTC